MKRKKELYDRALTLKALVYGTLLGLVDLNLIFILMGRLLFHGSRIAQIIADWVIDKANQNNVEFVGGPAVAAVPIIGAVVALSTENISPVKGFFVRSDKKDHGTQKNRR